MTLDDAGTTLVEAIAGIANWFSTGWNNIATGNFVGLPIGQALVFGIIGIIILGVFVGLLELLPSAFSGSSARKKVKPTSTKTKFLRRAIILCVIGFVIWSQL